MEHCIKRECGCEIELIDLRGGPSKLYLNVCANHRMDLEFRNLVLALLKSFIADSPKLPPSDPRG